MITAPEIDAYLAEHIPVSRAVGAKVLSYDENSIAFAAPLGENLNHRGTAFGGSLVTVGILAGWALINFNVRELGYVPRLVIQKSTMDFLLPVHADFVAKATKPALDEWQRFVRTLERRGMARLALQSHLYVKDALVAIHKGVYVSNVKEPPDFDEGLNADS